MADCTNCGENCTHEKETPAEIPYIVHEAEMARLERGKDNEIKRHMKDKRNWMIAFFVALALFFTTNIGWLIYESQFVTISYEQDGEGINNINTGEQGNIENGADTQNKNTQEDIQEETTDTQNPNP